MTHSGFLEYRFGQILDALRELEKLSPDGKISRPAFAVHKKDLLVLFHQMGLNAKKAKWYKPSDSAHRNPADRFAHFHPSKLPAKLFSYEFFEMFAEELLTDGDLIQRLAQLSGEENSKYDEVRAKREKRRDDLLSEYSDTRTKCWFSLTAITAVLLGATTVISATSEWLFFLPFIPLLLGCSPFCVVVFLVFERGTIVARVEDLENLTEFDSIYHSFATADKEARDLEANQEKWKNSWKYGRIGTAAGILMSVTVLLNIAAQ